MPRGASARRFAQAVFQIALENDDLDRWLDDLSLLASALENEEFAQFLDAPQIPLERKLAIINESLNGSVNPLALNLISLLASRNLAYLVPDIVEQYQGFLDAQRGIQRGEVISAIPLDDEQKKELTEMLQRMVGKEVRLTTRVEPSILGGVIARVGDHVIDGSTKSRLRAMRLSLVDQRR